MDPPIVSVVMCVYNGERYLTAAVDSILGQTMRDFEFVIVDDGSTDGTGAILRRYAETDDRVRVATRPHRGLIESLNDGCGLARGRYIARMDADDIALPDRLAKQVAFLDEHSEVSVVGGTIQMINDEGTALETIRLPEADREIKERLPHENAVAHVTALVRKDVLRAVGGYRRAFAHAEDYDLWLRVADHYRLANLPDVLVRCRTHPGSVSVRFRRQQVFSKLGAQLSAQRRRETGHDPLDGVDLVTPEVLRGLGVDDHTLSEQVVEHYIRTANHLARAGNMDEALAYLKGSLGETRTEKPESAERRDVARLYWEYANLSSQQGKFADAIRSVLRACILDPRSSKRLLRRFRLQMEMD